ncbi:kinase-like protein [Gyrodon lividus]|nr:kinase-like protein [Gyrodon lividus]
MFPLILKYFYFPDKEGPSGQHLAQKRSDSLQNKEWITQPDVDNDESGLDGMNEDGMAATESFNLPYDDLTMMISGKGTSPTCAGAFGKIWKCTMIRNHGTSNVHGSGTPVQVAVKTVEQSPKDGEWDVIYKHLRRELKVWARLSHTNIVPFLGITCNFGPLPAMVSPWYENGSLSAYLDVHPELPLSKKLSLLRDVANGLQYLHSQTPAVVHGDLHTGNVLIDNDGRACLTDFGLSLVIQEFSETSYLQSSVCGNLHYAAPELVNALAQSTGPLAYPKEPADIYSFGCIMMRVLTGEHPFKGVNIIALCTKICLEKRPSLPKSPGTSLETQAIMKRCWADAKTRPAATKVAQLLSELIRA